MICKLLLVDPACAFRLSRRKVLSATWLRSTMTQERFIKLKVLNSQKERTAKFAPPLPPTASKELVAGPRTLKTASRALNLGVRVGVPNISLGILNISARSPGDPLKAAFQRLEFWFSSVVVGHSRNGRKPWTVSMYSQSQDFRSSHPTCHKPNVTGNTSFQAKAAIVWSTELESNYELIVYTQCYSINAKCSTQSLVFCAVVSGYSQFYIICQDRAIFLSC